MQLIMSHKFPNGLLKLLYVALLAACIACLLTACNSEEKRQVSKEPCYDISFTYDDTSRTLSATEEILCYAPADLDSLVLHIYANAFDNAQIDISNVQIDRTNVDFEIYGSDRTLMRIPADIDEGDTCSLRLEYSVTVPYADARLGKTSLGTVNLSCFYPVLARFDGEWREDEYVNLGDPFFSDTASYFVRAIVDEGLNIACSGVKEERIENGMRYAEIEATSVRDFAMVLGKLEACSADVSLESGTVSVDLYYPKPSAMGAAMASDVSSQTTFPTAETAAALLARACDCIKVFSEAFGDYPYPAYTIAVSAISGAGGMEYGSMAIICPTANDADNVVIHETAHQWWYGAVGNDQLNDAWLDEGLSEYCTAYYYFLIGDRTDYAAYLRTLASAYAEFAHLKATVGFDGRMTRHLSTYLTDGEYAAVTYVKGALLFDCLHTLVGDGKFLAAMKTYYADNKYCIADADDLEAAFQAQGYNIRPLLDDWLNDTLNG